MQSSAVRQAAGTRNWEELTNVDRRNNRPRRDCRIQNPVSRRVFMKLAAHAGVAIPAASALGGSAWAADPTPKAATIVATLANDYWAAFIKGFKATAASLKFDTEDLYHDNDAARELAQVRALPTSGVNMLINTVVAAGEVPMVAKICQENKIFYTPYGRYQPGSLRPTSAITSSLTTPPNSTQAGLRGREGTVQVDRRRRRRRAHQGPCDADGRRAHGGCPQSGE